MMANPNFANKSPERSGELADIIAEMDYRVGQVLDAVKEEGVDENTIFILQQRQRGRRGNPTNRVGFEGRGAAISSTRRSREACGCLQ